MDVSTLPAPTTGQQPVARMVPSAPTPATTPTRPGRRPGPGTGPQARPTRPLGAPVLARGRGPAARSCQIAAPRPAGRPSAWRLTDRGIAFILVAGLLLTTAALAVITLTAVRVTGERYQPQGRALSAQVTGAGAAADVPPPAADPVVPATPSAAVARSS